MFTAAGGIVIALFMVFLIIPLLRRSLTIGRIDYNILPIQIINYKVQKLFTAINNKIVLMSLDYNSFFSINISVLMC